MGHYLIVILNILTHLRISINLIRNYNVRIMLETEHGERIRQCEY